MYVGLWLVEVDAIPGVDLKVSWGLRYVLLDAGGLLGM